MAAARRVLPGAVAVAVLALVLWWGADRATFANYDLTWVLVWGRDLAGGLGPDLGRPFTPTPHPLADLLSTGLGPLGDRATGGGALGGWNERLAGLFGPLLTATVAVLGLALARAWFGVVAGLIVLGVLLTREPLLSYGLRGYLDLGYVAFLLVALLLEVRRPLNGMRTLAAITLAGLMRPEAWLLAGAYLAWLLVARADARRPRRLAGLLLLAAVAPAGWLLEGLILAGDPLYALTGTRANAEDLGRPTGLLDGLLLAPRRLGEIVREPVLLGAVVGAVGTLVLLPRDAPQHRAARLVLSAGLAAFAAFLVLATAGLPVLTRYLLFPAVLVVALCGAGLVGWRWLPAGARGRRAWMVGAALTAVAFVALAPAQVGRLERLRGSLILQEGTIDRLRVLGAGPRAPIGRALAAGCTVALPNHRPIPQLVLWTGDRSRTPGDGPTARRRIDALERPGTPDVYVRPSSLRIARGFVLDRADEADALPPIPRGLRATGVQDGDDVWLVAARPGRCTRAVRSGRLPTR